MRWMIESIRKRIEDSKLNIAEAYVEFFGEKYRDRIIDRVGYTEVLVYQSDIDKETINRFIYLLSLDKSYDNEIKKYIDELKFAKRYIHILENFDKTMTNVCKHYFPIREENFNAENFINALRVFDKKEKLSIEEKNRLKNILYESLDIIPEMSSTDIISRESLDEFKDAIKRMRRMKSKILVYLENNLEDLTEELLSRGCRNFRLSKPKKMESYCTCAKKYQRIIPVCIFNFESLSFGRESLFSHEFGHAIDINDDLRKHGLMVKDNYRLLNESLTDAIANEVTNIMKRKKQTIFINKPKSLTRSKYAVLLPLGKALIENFKMELPIMKFGTEEDLYGIIDKDTLDILEELCIKAMYDENASKKDKKGYIEEAVKIIENYKNRKSRY